MAKVGVNVLQTENTTVEYSLDSGTKWYKIPAAGEFSSSGGTPEITSGRTWDGAYQVVGGAGAGEADIVFPAWVADHAAWDDLFTKFEGGNQAILYRVTTAQEDPVVSRAGAGNTIAIATTGIVTFAGDFEFLEGSEIDISPGMTIKQGSNSYKIDKIDSAGGATAVTVRPAPALALAATVSYQIQNRQHRWQFRARLREPIHPDATTQLLTTTLALALTGAMPRPTFV